MQKSSSYRLFGGLPEYPPVDCQEEQFCEQCQQCIKQLAATNDNNSKLKSKHIRQQLFSNRPRKLKHLCEININSDTRIDLKTEITKEIDKARKKTNKIKQHLQFKDPNTELLQRNQRIYHYQLQNATIDDKYNRILKQKSQKAHDHNFAKKIKSSNKQAETLRNQIADQRKSAFVVLRQEKLQYLKRLHNMIFQLEKEKLIYQKKTFKEEMSGNAERASKELQALQTKNQHNLQYLRQVLEEVKKEKQINKVDQKHVLRDLEQKLKQDQKQYTLKCKSKIQVEVEKVRCANNNKFVQKVASL